MSSKNKPFGFKIVERDGYKEREVIDADSLEELQQKLEQKTGGWL